MDDPRVYSSDELLLERHMQALGEDRVNRRLTSARDADRYTQSIPGRAMLRKYVDPVARVLTAWMVAEEDRKAGCIGRLHERLNLIGTAAASLVGVQLVVDAIHRPRTLASLSVRIGLALEDTWRAGEMRRANPGLWRDMMAKTRKNRPSRRRSRTFRAGRFHEVLPSPWPTSEKAQLGLIIVDALVLATDLIEVVVQPKPGVKTIKMVRPTLATLEWIEGAEGRAVSTSPYFLPMVEEPVPWEGTEGGGYLTDMVLRRPVARFHSKAQQKAMEAADPSCVYESMNRLQATAWMVNEDVHQVLEEAWSGAGGFAGIPDREDLPIPPRLQDWDTRTDDFRVRYVREARVIHQKNGERRSKRFATAMHRTAANLYAGKPRLYYPHRLDFRGRVYTTPVALSCQGPDLCRGLLRFADEDPVFDAGDRAWLGIHGANCFGVRGSIEGRLGWALAEGDAIASEVDHDPLEARGVWGEADDPWQFLAWCLEWSRVRSGGTTGLPVHVDASNNGLQLLALLGGDRDLAHATNVLGSDPQAPPHDVYTAVSETCTARLRAEAAENPLAAAWVEAFPDGVPRKAVKRPVMTLPYGVTNWSATAYVRDWSRENGVNEIAFPGRFGPACMYLAGMILDEVRSACAGAVRTMGWLQEVSDIVTKAGGALPSWVTPSGFPVVHHYRKSDLNTVHAPMAVSIKQLSLRVGTPTIDVRRSRQGMAPNFVHSLDAAILAKAVADWDGPIATVHDSFATTSPRMPELQRRLRRSIVECLIERDPLTELADRMRTEHRVDIPDPPAKLGTIEADEILSSQYLLS